QISALSDRVSEWSGSDIKVVRSRLSKAESLPRGMHGTGSFPIRTRKRSGESPF
ncbi:unnamed protein product, partial [Ectocarpus sp. 12 AP-2014]